MKISKRKKMVWPETNEWLKASIYILLNTCLFLVTCSYKCCNIQSAHACQLKLFVAKSDDKWERIEFDYTSNFKEDLYSLVCNYKLVNRSYDWHLDLMQHKSFFKQCSCSRWSWPESSRWGPGSGSNLAWPWAVLIWRQMIRPRCRIWKGQLHWFLNM